MPKGYDGEIRIDTRVDEKGFNAGVKNIAKQVGKVGEKLLTAVAITGAVAVGIMVVVASVTRLIKGVTQAANKVMRLGGRTEALKQEFTNLRMSVYNAFLPLLQVALPVLQQVAAWLTRIFNIVGMVMGALLGQKTVMQATASAAADAAGSTGKMAKGAKDAEKAAKGALAAFDEINVLQQEESGDDAGGVGALGTAFTEVPIFENILEIVEKIKAFFGPITESVKNLWDSLVGLWEATKKAFEPWFAWVKDLGILEFIRNLVVDGIDWLSERIQDLTTWIGGHEEAWRAILTVLAAIGVALLLIVSPTALVIAAIMAVIAAIALLISYWPVLKAGAIDAWEGLKKGWSTAANWFIANVWKPLVDGAANVIRSIGQFFVDLWENVTNWSAAAVKGLLTLFSDLWNGLLTGWKMMFDYIKTGFTTVFNGVVSVVKGAINMIIGFINAMLSGIATGINTVISALNKLSFTIPDWVPIFGGHSWGFNIASVSAPQIPLLAQGAVIPPNSQFLAVLGDQRAGTNIETPEGLLREIIREELDGMGGQDITISFAGSMSALIRELKPYSDKEDKRVGVSMVRGIS